MKRIFIAIRIKPGDRLLGAVQNLQEEMAGDHIRWVDMNQLHITLAFLGDTPESKVKPLTQLLDDAAGSTGEFSFRITGLGVFRSIKDPRVIWAGIESSEELEDLYNKIKTGLKVLGTETEERPFRPHLTLGRIKSLNNPARLGEILGNYEHVHFQSVMVYELILYESILSSSGPTYISLHNAGMQSACL